MARQSGLNPAASAIEAVAGQAVVFASLPVYTENLIRVDEVMESPKLAE